MNSIKTCSILLLVVPLLIVCSPVMAARRAVKEGCLNYGPACLGGHGKRSTLHTSIPELLMMKILYKLLESPDVSSSHSKDNSDQGINALYHHAVSTGRFSRTTPTQYYDDNLEQSHILDNEDRVDYADEDDGRLDLKRASSTKEDPETYSDSEWQSEVESRDHHKERNDNKNYIKRESWRKR